MLRRDTVMSNLLLHRLMNEALLLLREPLRMPEALLRRRKPWA